MATRPEILDRIEKILSKTTANGATAAEAESALLTAQRLMAEHNLTMADLKGKKGKGGRLEPVEAWRFGKMKSQIGFILPVLEEAFTVRCCLLQQREKSPKGERMVGVRVTLIGEAPNVEAATWALTYCEHAFRALWDRHRIEHKAPTAAMHPYYGGLQMGLLARLRAGRQAILAELPGAKDNLPVLARWVDAAFDQAYPGATNMVPRGDAQAHAETVAAGIADSREVTLARPIADQAPEALEDQPPAARGRRKAKGAPTRPPRRVLPRPTKATA